AEVGAPAAADDLVAGLAGPLDETLHPLAMLAVDQGRARRPVVPRVTEDVLVGEAAEELEELVGNRLLDEQARAGEADLACVVVLARAGSGGGLEFGVGEDDERPLAAELGRERHQIPRRRLR